MTSKKRKTCKCCKAKFTPSRSDQVFCCAECRVKESRKETDKNTTLLNQLRNTGFFNYLQFQCRRAGTVEIVPTKLETLIELHSIWSYNNKANGYKKEREYEISHIFPVSGAKGGIGSLYPSNLVVQPARFNRSHSNKYLGHGHCVNSYRLKPEYKLDEYAKKDEILSLIFKRIGVSTLRQFKKEAKPTTLAIIKELEWFEKHVCIVDESIKLHEMDLEQLRQLKSAFTKATVWNTNWTAYTTCTVLLHEIERLSIYRSELSTISSWWKERIKVSPDDFWLYTSPEEVGNSAYYHEATHQLQAVLVGKEFDLDAIHNACQTAYKAAYDKQAHKLKVEDHIRALSRFGVITHKIDNTFENVPFASGGYVFTHTGKPFDVSKALDTPIPDHSWYEHADHPEIMPFDLVCYLPSERTTQECLDTPF